MRIVLKNRGPLLISKFDMSRFFAASSSSEDEEEYTPQQKGNRFGTFYDSDEEVYNENEDFSDEGSEEESGSEVESEDNEAEGAESSLRNRFLFGSESENESDEEGRRQVKSQKEKAEEEFEGYCDDIEDALDQNDWSLVQTGISISSHLNSYIFVLEYEKLVKAMNKNSKHITERVFEILKLIEASATEISNEEKKKMPGANAKAFNAIRQKNKKIMVQFEDIIKRPDSSARELEDLATSKAVEEEVMQKVIEMTPENVLRKLQEVVSHRGRRHSDKQENLATLRKLYEMALNDHHRVQVVVGIIAAVFDMIVASLGYLPLELWLEAVDDLDRLIALLKGLKESSVLINAEAEDLGLPGLQSLQGSLLSFVHRLDDEFTRALQIIDPHTTEYEEFLRSESSLYSILQKCREYFVAIGNGDFESQIVVRQLEHLYFRSSSLISHFNPDSTTLARLCEFIYEGPYEKLKVRALLMHVYHLSLHGQYVRARDIFLTSQVSEHLGNLEVSTQILYNRTVVQLGLAAFQRGLLKECYFALQEICSSGRPRELLAQGLQSQKFSDRTPEQERSEKQRQLPHHMHISIELIDSVFLTTSMLLEIPQAAASARRFFKGEKKLFPSRHLRRLIDSCDRSLFNGPPENTRDHIISAAKALANGQWLNCLNLVLKAKLWDLFPSSESIKSMLERKIKEAGFCTFILAFGPSYSSLSLTYLAASFDMPENLVCSIISRLVQEHGLPARIEHGFLLWSVEIEISPLQELILQLKDKVNVLSERNRECLEVMDREITA